MVTPAQPLTSRLLVLLSLHNLLLSLSSILNHIGHVLIGSHKLLPLVLSVGVDLTSDSIDVIHQGLGLVEHLLTLIDHPTVKVSFGLNLDGLLVQ